MKLCMIYITAKSKDEAKLIGHELVTQKLAACANIIYGMNSIYRWEGKLEYDSEAVLILKTRANLAKKVISRVKELHSYSCPCVLVLPVQDGNPEYLQWIAKETK